jgi:hypothetical protein
VPPTASRAFDIAGRIGLVAKGAIFVVLGVLAVLAASHGKGGATPGKAGVLKEIARHQLGTILIGALLAGLVALTVWLAVTAFAPDTKLSKRISGLFSAGVYGTLAVGAWHLLRGVGSPSATSDTESARDWTARLMEQPFGPWLVGAVGVGLGIFGLAQLRKAFSEKFWKYLDSSKMSDGARKLTRRAGQLGIGARGIVFLILGGFLILAALHHDPREAVGLSGALRTLAGAPYGPWLLGLVAAGLAAYGLFTWILALYGTADRGSGR